MNTYKPNDKGEICVVDATGKLWPCEVAHPLPLPEGIDDAQEDNGFYSIYFAPDAKQEWDCNQSRSATHWLARRPLPPAPKPKSQSDLDEEFIEKTAQSLRERETTSVQDIRDGMKAALAYARKEKP